MAFEIAPGQPDPPDRAARATENMAHFHGEDLLRKAQEHLRDQAGVVIRPGARIGAPADSVLEHVETHGLGLIAMATHGHSGLKRWVYGSMTAKAAQCQLFNVSRSADRRRVELAHPIFRRIPC
jgi:nucleotide-binding universal stress UspA family protein